MPLANGDVNIDAGHDNLLMWCGVSKELIVALNELVREEYVYLQPLSVYADLSEGTLPKLPMAKSNRDYKKPH